MRRLITGLKGPSCAPDHRFGAYKHRLCNRPPSGGAGQLIVRAVLLVALAAGACNDQKRVSEPPSTDGAGPGIDTAPRSQRVDLDQPSFSDPTAVTNPLFPSSNLGQVVQLGNEGGEELRVEITPLSSTKTIAWKGRRIETLVSHFIAFLDGRIVETAVDFFAQADDGAVWYLGEDSLTMRTGWSPTTRAHGWRARTGREE